MHLRLCLTAALLCLGAPALHAAVDAREGACDTPLGQQVSNGCVVAEGALWRGARPTSHDASELLQLGVKTVVNLQWLHDDERAFRRARSPLANKESVQQQPRQATSQPALEAASQPAQQPAWQPPVAGLEVLMFRVKDWEPLIALSHRHADDRVAKFIAITRSQPKPIYVHCRSGRNRTGVMVAAWRIFEGMPIEEAIHEMSRYQGEWLQADAAYLRTLTPKHRAALEGQIQAWQQKLSPSATLRCDTQRCQWQESEKAGAD